MYKISVYIPLDNVEDVMLAMFNAGAGKLGNYDQCAWQTQGRGQFRPLPGSNPAIGEQDRVTTVDEMCVEMLCAEDCLDAALLALRDAHPYETPAFTVWKVRTD